MVRRCALAAAAGVAEAMDLAHARSLLPARMTLHVEPHRPDRDAEALHALACRALRFSPLVAPDAPDGLVLDVTGTELVHGGEARLVRAVAASMSKLGFSSRVAVASTWACAWGVARFGERDLIRVSPGDERAAIERLPIAALQVDEAMVSALATIGIVAVGHVLALPRAALAARFEPILLERVDKVLGRAIESFEPVRPAPPLRAELLFDGPTDRWESVETATRRVLDELAAELARRERGVRLLTLALRRPRAAPESIEIVLSHPSRSVKHLWSLVRSRLERVDLGEGVEGVTLVAARTARLRHRQSSSNALGADDEAAGIGAAGAWGELVDMLVERLDADHVVRMETVESHLPERAFRERTVVDARASGVPSFAAAHTSTRSHSSGPRNVGRAATSRAKTRRRRGGSTQHDSCLPAAPPRLRAPTDAPPPSAVIGRAFPDRPTLLLATPEPAQVVALTPDGPVLGLRWRGAASRIVSCTGPERISTEWWRWGSDETSASSPPDRDYFAVQTESGRWLWVCRQVGTARWFVHGLWT